MNILEIFNPYIDNKYQLFQKRICHTKYIILGIKVPILRKITKDLLTNYNYQDILNLDNNYYEVILIKGIVIASVNISYQEKLLLIKDYLDLIDNWAICDIFVGNLKMIKDYQKDFLEYLKYLLTYDKDYYKRFVIVCLLNYYINQEYIDNNYQILLSIKSDNYYVNMAIAWNISMCLIKYFDKTIKFMNDNNDQINKFVFNKSLDKGIDSYQISKECKDILKKMKRK